MKSRLIDQRLNNIPHKEKKFARTRIALLYAFLAEIQTQHFDKIKIRELCLAAEISEPTFYNYFPEKIHLLNYFIQIWSLQVTIYATGKNEQKSGYGLLKALFAYTAIENKKNPRVLQEIISFQVKNSPLKDIPPLTLAERYILFPDIPEIETIPAEGIGGILKTAMQTALAQNELPAGTDIHNLSLAIASLFFGGPVIAFTMKCDLANLWETSLTLLWQGAGGT